MSLQVAIGSLAQPTSTGNQSVTGLGFQPVAILFFGAEVTSDGTGAPAKWTWGFAANGTNVNRSACFRSSDGATPTSQVQCYFSESKCIGIIASSGVVAEASLSSFDAGGFTLNWSTVDASARIINYIALGGTDITNANCLTMTVPTAAGNASFTGVGFKPDLVFLINNNQASAGFNSNNNIAAGLGVAISSSSRFAIAQYDQESAGPSSTKSILRTDRCLAIANPGFGNGTEADFVSMDTDGMTLNFVTVPSTGPKVLALCLKGTFQKTITTFTQASSTGNQATTGVGFQPVLDLFATIQKAVSTSGYATARNAWGGATDSAHRFVVWSSDADNSSPTIAKVAGIRTACIDLRATDATLTAEADFVSQNADGYTVNWTTASADGAQVAVLSLGNAAVLATTIAGWETPFLGRLNPQFYKPDMRAMICAPEKSELTYRLETLAPVYESHLFRPVKGRGDQADTVHRSEGTVRLESYALVYESNVFRPVKGRGEDAAPGKMGELTDTRAWFSVAESYPTRLMRGRGDQNPAEKAETTVVPLSWTPMPYEGGRLRPLVGRGDQFPPDRYDITVPAFPDWGAMPYQAGRTRLVWGRGDLNNPEKAEITTPLGSWALYEAGLTRLFRARNEPIMDKPLISELSVSNLSWSVYGTPTESGLLRLMRGRGEQTRRKSGMSRRPTSSRCTCCRWKRRSCVRCDGGRTVLSPASRC